MANEEFKHIVRVSNTDLDGNKSVVDSLRKIRGISFMFANAICQIAGVDRTQQMGLASEADVKKIQAVIDDPVGAGVPTWLLNRRKDVTTGKNDHLIVNDLIIANEDDIKRMRKMKSYRGMRHARGLPVRGQRTKSNFRKNKGKK